MLKRLNTALTWLLTVLFLIFYFILFRLLNQITVIGLESVIPHLKKGKVIIVTNHRSMLNSVFVTCTLYGPWILCPTFFDRLPYHAAAVENYFRWWNAWLYRRVRALPIKPGRHDTRILLQMVRLLTKGKSVHIYPQGGRGRTDEIVFRGEGVGYLARKTAATIIVGHFWGMEKVLPVGRR